MKQVFRYDSDGVYKEPVILQDNELIPNDCTEKQPPDGLFNGKFVGGQWVEGDQNLSLSMKKAKKITELNDLCNQAILGNFTATIGGVVYSFSHDAEAQSNFNTAKLAFMDGTITTTIKWTAYDADGNVTRINLSKVDFDVVYMAKLQHVNDNVSKLRDTLELQVEAATTQAALDAIIW